MSNSYNGGSERYSRFDVPEKESDIVKVLERFMRDKMPDDVAETVIRDPSNRIVLFADGTEDDSPTGAFPEEGELVAYGSFVYEADHSVQTIWENQFEIRVDDDEVIVAVSDWLGTALDTWSKKVERGELYV